MPSRSPAFNPTLYEIQMTVPSHQLGAEDLLRQMLEQQGFSETQIVTTAKAGHAVLTIYVDRKAVASSVVRKINGLKVRGSRTRVKEMGVRDWRDAWKKDLKPFALTARFDVVPVWNQAQYRPGKRIPIYLDTILSFGTGYHETTRFMAQMIERCSGRFQSFLDIGTGTGLLAIVAGHCGASEIWAVDIDPNCLKTARANFAKNQLRGVRLRTMDFKTAHLDRKFDFISANIITDELIALRDTILRHLAAGGFLAVSGISLNNLPRFRASFRLASLRCVKIYRGRKWAGMLYQKRERHG
ncbi:MAG TPA: 50S ribosomal protein L11 methyltransferase [Candidatus Bathyarchaeia archaeon]|nr:50S ribosomal protein L11 methyltransferase [Candidatus Bathyarchaeia archaeon]